MRERSAYLTHTYQIREEKAMKLSAPKQITWWAGLVILVVGVIGNFIGALNPFAIWIVAIAAVLMLIATAVQGL